MEIKGRLVEKFVGTNCPYVSKEKSSFNTQSVERWGVLVAHGDRRTFLVADVYGYQIAVVLSDLTTEQRKEMVAQRKLLTIDPIMAASIRTSKRSAIIWHS